ncbi:MAG TPA: HAMP domain-containing sensor histidine kinase [Candidatus Angelobacter sp.]|nr:HAMP domain-containing sensor histidine kinase [Candidatus Angelobacter sp.]
MAHDLNLRVLVLAQFGRDSELLQAFLKRHNFYSHVVSSAEELLKELERGAGIGIVTEESFNMPLESWTRRLAIQPSWSDFPLIVLTGAGESWVPSPYLAELRSVGNVTLVERPIRSDSLLSAVESAMRARMRQYEVRDFLRRQADSEEALRKTEKLAVAGRLAASLAHEINNPLTAVTNLLFLIRGARDLAEAKKYGAQAEDELRRVTEIANHTLRFHRSSHGPELVEVAPLLDSAVSLFKAKLRNQDIKVKIECSERCRATFVLGEIRQVLVNLIANAIDAMPRGGGLLVRGLTRPHPGTSMPGLHITVADHGEGIPPKALPRLFEPFFTTKGSIGTGLGLWLTKDIIDRHHGFIRMRNHHHPHGAVFSFWIPEKPTAQAL